jgi:hypothetical protein
MKPSKILLTASAIFLVCIVIAYHNTASIGYDKHDIIYYNSEGVDIMDYHIEYDVIRYKLKKIKEIAPDSFVTI